MMEERGSSAWGTAPNFPGQMTRFTSPDQRFFRRRQPLDRDRPVHGVTDVQAVDALD